MEEIEKSRIIINQLRKNRAESVVAEEEIEEEFHASIEIPESEEEKIQVLFDSCLKDKNRVDLTKYMKIFDQGENQILGIAMPK